jgi:thiol-disulfide isomerase/thioredoxin
MSTRRHFFWLAMAMIAGVAGIWLVTRQNDTDTSNVRIGTAIGEAIPDIRLAIFDGRELMTSDLHGKVVLINAFASWCGPCRAETPDLIEFYQANQDKVVLIGLNIGENEAAVFSYQQDFGVPYPLVLDLDGTIAEHFRPQGLPTTWFIDPQGIVQTIHVGPLTAELMEQITTEIY